MQIYVTIDLRDVTNNKTELKPEGHLSFTGTANGAEYAVDLQLHGEIDVEASQISVSPRSIFIILAKKEEGPYWPRLSKDSSKAVTQFIKADWDKWVDEDEVIIIQTTPSP